MARVTIYIPDYLHQRWRDDHPNLNLSKAAQRGLYEAMKAEGDDEIVMLCDLCRQRAGQPLPPAKTRDVARAKTRVKSA